MLIEVKSLVGERANGMIDSSGLMIPQIIARVCYSPIYLLSHLSFSLWRRSKCCLFPSCCCVIDTACT